jgi:hypothetical protein
VGHLYEKFAMFLCVSRDKFVSWDIDVPLSTYWIVQQGMMMGNSTLFMLNEYKYEYDSREKDKKNAREE